MTDEHLIAFICLVTEKGYQIAELTSADKPEADFAIVEGDVRSRFTSTATCTVCGSLRCSC